MRPNYRGALQVAVASVLACAGSAGRAFGQTTASWLSPVSDSWASAPAWSSNPSYPNNGTPVGSTYAAVIAATGGNYTVTLNGPVTVSSLTLNAPGAMLFQNGPSLGVTGAVAVNAGTYLLAGSTLTSGSLTVAGRLDWYGGTIGGGTGTALISPGGVLRTFDGINARTLTRRLENAGTVNLAAGSIDLAAGTFVNQSTGVVNISEPTAFTPYSGNRFVNNGTINLLSTTLSGFTSPMINSGTINVASGVSGYFNAYPSTFTFNTGATITGAGSISLGITVLNGTTTFAGTNMAFNNGTLNGPGALNVTGHLLWGHAGTIGGSGVMTIAPGASVQTNSDTQLSRELDNAGTLSVSTSALTLKDGTLVNQTGGVVNVNDATGFYMYPGTTHAITNNGTINFAYASDMYLHAEITNNGTIAGLNGAVHEDVAIHNNGAVVVGPPQGTSATLDFVTPPTNVSGATLTGGRWIVHQNSSLTMGTVALSINNADVVLDGAGSSFPAIDSLRSNLGAFTIGNGRNFTTVGTLSNSGTVVVGPKSTLAVKSALENAGTVDVSGVVTIDYGDTSPIASVAAQLHTGYAGGAWTGPGIHSSAAAAATQPPKTLAVGYAEAAQLFSAFPATYRGQSVDATTVLIACTLNGDSDLNGNVDLTDFTYLAANFNKTGGATWLQGDYNYDGNVDLTDFTFLASNFNQSLPLPADGGSLGSFVPEPTAIASTIAAITAFLATRRRRHTALPAKF